MPTLEIEKCQERFTEWTVLKVQAVMIHPHNPKWRQELLAMELAKRFADHRLTVQSHLAELTSQFFQTLLEIPPRQKYTERNGKGMARGHIAGHILLLLKQMEQIENCAGSLNRAMFLYKKEAAARHADNQYIPKNSTSLSSGCEF